MPGGLRIITTALEKTNESLHRTRVETETTRTTVNQYLTFVLKASAEADAKLKETEASAQLTMGQIVLQLHDAQRAAESVEAEYKALLERLAAPENLFDYGGQSLEEFIANQKGLIEQIGGGGFGAHLDYYAKAYIDTLLGNQAALTGSAQKQLETSEWIIRNFTGSAGQKFDFWQFKADIDAALKGLKAEISGSSSGGYGGTYGSTSGVLGSNNNKPGCGASMPSLSILAQSGALRWR
jgi:hypothetical protein